MPTGTGRASANDPDHSLVSRARGLLGKIRRRARSEIDRQLYEVGYGWGPRLMSAIRKRWILLSHPHADIRFEGPVHIGPGFSLYIPQPGSFIVGPDVEFRKGFRAEVTGGGRVVIGARCIFSYYSLIQITGSLEIGEGCGFGQSCAIFDGNHNFKDLTQPFVKQGFELRPIRIGDECGVLTKTTVLADIGDRAQVGANSVVVNPIPAYTVAVGAPARVVSYFGPEDQRPPELDDHDLVDTPS
jgi:acetyltransferase-like isoleucine patch superfamily enzyme